MPAADHLSFTVTAVDHATRPIARVQGFFEQTMYADAIADEARARTTGEDPDGNRGRQRFTAVLDGILSHKADDTLDIRSDVVRTVAVIFLEAGWDPAVVVGFTRDHVPDEAIADPWPHDPDCWCPPCLYLADTQGGDDVTDDVLRVLAADGVTDGWRLDPGPGTPHFPILDGSVFMSDDEGGTPKIQRPYVVGILFDDARPEHVLWRGDDFTAATAAVAVAVRICRHVRIVEGGGERPWT